MPQPRYDRPRISWWLRNLDVMADSSTIPTTFLILSDTHNFNFADASEGSRPLQLPTPPVDVLLHCGDLTQVGGIYSFKRALEMLGSMEAELKLVIAGNHDLELDQQYWKAQKREDPGDHELAIKTMTGPLADEAGVSFLNEGTHFFTLKNGASLIIYVSPYSPAYPNPFFSDWAFAYKHHEDRFNQPHHAGNGATSIARYPIPDTVDIVMTHGPPKGILDWCPEGNVGCKHLLQAIRRVKPKMHCFGHIHESNGVEIIDWRDFAERPRVRKNEAVHRYFEEDPIENPYPRHFRWENGNGNQTLAVNAAIMNGNNRPENAPWLISLDLPRSF